MTYTISGTVDTLVTLDAAIYDPTTITASGLLNDGVDVSFAGLTLLNAGSIAPFNEGTIGQPGPGFSGVYFAAGGTITNQSSGRITGLLTGGGVNGRNAAVTVVNAGVISNDSDVGVYLHAGGRVTNLSGGTISGGFWGVGGAGIAVVNAGTIGPGRFGGDESGVSLRGGSVENESGGLITGQFAIEGAQTVVNAGTIASTYGAAVAVYFTPGATNWLVVEPGAVFTGLVDGGNMIGATSISTMELAGTSAGTLSGIGTQFINFAQTTIDAAASWTFSGGDTLASGTTLTNAGTLTVLNTTFSDDGLVVNNGLIQIDPSTVTLGTLTGTGSVAIGGGGTLDATGSVAAGETIVFNGGGNLLGIDPTGFAGQIDGFIVGDTIALIGVTDGVSAGIVNGNTLQIERSTNPAVDLTLDPGVDYADNVYAVSVAGAVTEAPCFLRGTLIRTEHGEVAVQELAPGDRVRTLSGEIRPITWIGTGEVLVSPGRRCAATPVIVRKGALADNVPHHDLRITKGHELFLDGVLVPVEFLINHRSILWDDHQQTVSFYHVELATHDVLLANGAAAESYRDDGNRCLFQDANGGWDEAPKPPCAPVLTGGPIVDAIWQRLLDRAGPRPGVPLTGDPDLHLLVDGKRLEATTRTDSVYVFNLPRTAAGARVISRAAAPQELGLARDPRNLGVALRRIIVRQMNRFRVIEAKDERLEEGFHAFERGNGLRWTDGDATLPAALIQGFDGVVELELYLGGVTRYPTLGQAVPLAAA